MGTVYINHLIPYFLIDYELFDWKKSNKIIEDSRNLENLQFFEWCSMIKPKFCIIHFSFIIKVSVLYTNYIIYIEWYIIPVLASIFYRGSRIADSNGSGSIILALIIWYDFEQINANSQVPIYLLNFKTLVTGKDRYTYYFGQPFFLLVLWLWYSLIHIGKLI